jgi:hypothetical protein
MGKRRIAWWGIATWRPSAGCIPVAAGGYGVESEHGDVLSSSNMYVYHSRECKADHTKRHGQTVGVCCRTAQIFAEHMQVWARIGIGGSRAWDRLVKTNGPGRINGADPSGTGRGVRHAYWLCTSPQVCECLLAAERAHKVVSAQGVGFPVAGLMPWHAPQQRNRWQVVCFESGECNWGKRVDVWLGADFWPCACIGRN